jgi:spore maturation protein SpmA
MYQELAESFIGSCMSDQDLFLGLAATLQLWQGQTTLPIGDTAGMNHGIETL